MADRNPAADWWKVVPCHFIWKLEENVYGDFEAVVNNLDSKLETKNEIEWIESACDMLLFRGYLEVSNFEGVQHNPQKAEEFFIEAENEAMKVTDDEERQAYIIIVTVNRLWLLEPPKEGDHNEGRRSRLIADLEDTWGRHRDRVSQDKLQSFIDATAAFALARLGPNKYKEAERLYQRALKTIKTKSSWYQTLGEVIGRQGRKKVDNYNDSYDVIHDEIRCYEKAIYLDPKNNSARCDLAMVLLRIPDRKPEARDLMNNLDENSCEVILKKGRFYRRLGELTRALEVLLRGETLLHPRSDLFLQISYIYQDLAKEASNRDDKNEHNRDDKNEHKRKEMWYIDKCLALEPSHFNGQLKKAIALAKARRNEEALAMFLDIIKKYKSFPYNLIEAQYRYAVCLSICNRPQLNDEIARAFEDVIDTAIDATRNRNMSDGGQIRLYAGKAKKRLHRYYDSLNSGEIRRLILRSRMADIGFDD